MGPVGCKVFKVFKEFKEFKEFTAMVGFAASLHAPCW
jgi:hypothetical protein